MIRIAKERFGPWALITGASSGIGREFARQLAKAGLNTVLVARRRELLQEAGDSLAKDFGVQYRVITADFSEEGFVETLANSTDDLDIGLVVSNAGSPSPGGFLSKDRDELASQLRLNALSHLDIAHHFGRKLAARGRGRVDLRRCDGSREGDSLHGERLGRQSLRAVPCPGTTRGALARGRPRDGCVARGNRDSRRSRSWASLRKPCP